MSSVTQISEARKKKDVIEALREAVLRLKAHWVELYDEYENQKRRIRQLERENAQLKARLRGGR